MTKVRFTVEYDYINSGDDEKLSEEAATAELLLRQGQGDHPDKHIHEFDDIDMCTSLLSSSDEILGFYSVELDRIKVFNASLPVMGLQAQYKCESYDDDQIRFKKGAMHYFAKENSPFVAVLGRQETPIATIK
jgi:hypothetical protein